jgi:hypothetical protein
MSILLPTAYLPPINYISECLNSETVFIEAFETYTKQTCRNHCIIAGPNGIQQLTVPVNKVDGNHTLTKDIRISYFQDWQKMHWRSIETAYNNSPFFLYYRDYFEPFFSKKTHFLIDLNLSLFEVIFNILRIEKETEFTEQYDRNPRFAIDRRNVFGSKKSFIVHPAKEYTQVFRNKSGFITNLSIIDLIFNLGPETVDYFA